MPTTYTEAGAWLSEITGIFANGSYSGVSGFSGYSGTNGSGTSGFSGATGATGTSGFSGKSGYSGVAPTNTANLTGQTSTVASLLVVTPSANSTLLVGGYITTTASGTFNLVFSVSYTDQNNNPQSLTLFSVTTSAVGTAYTFAPQMIRVKASTTATVAVTLSGSNTFDCGAVVMTF